MFYKEAELNPNPSVINSTFINLIKTAEGLEEVVDNTETYLRLKLREEGFFRKVLPPRLITPAELDRAVDHRSPMKIIDIEPDAPAAVTIDFRGGVPTKYVGADRYAVTFYTISSVEHQYREPELLTYKAPITAILKDILDKEIQAAEDRNFIKACDEAVQISGNIVNSENTVFIRDDFVDILDKMTEKKLVVDVVLMPLSMFYHILKWDFVELGSELLKEVVIDGYKYNTLLGKKFVTTNKYEIIGRKNAYAFTEPKFLGHAFLLDQDVKFQLITEYDLIKFKMWENIGAGIGNANAVVKLTLSEE